MAKNRDIDEILDPEKETVLPPPAPRSQPQGFENIGGGADDTSPKPAELLEPTPKIPDASRYGFENLLGGTEDTAPQLDEPKDMAKEDVFAPDEPEQPTPIVDISAGFDQAAENLKSIRSSQEAKIAGEELLKQPASQIIAETPAQRVELRASGGKIDSKQARLQRFKEERLVRNRIHGDREFLLSPQDVEETINSINVGIAGEDVRNLSRAEIGDISPLLSGSAVGRDVLRRSSLELSQRFSDFLDVKGSINTTAELDEFVDSATTNPLVGGTLRQLVDGLKTGPTGRATEFGKKLALGDKDSTDKQKNTASVRFDFNENALPGQTFTEFVNANYRLENGLFKPLETAEKAAKKKEQDEIHAVAELLGGVKFEDMSTRGMSVMLSRLTPGSRKFYLTVLSKKDGVVEIDAEAVAKFNAEVEAIRGDLIGEVVDALANISITNDMERSYLDELRGIKAVDKLGRPIGALEMSRKDPQFINRAALTLLEREIGGVDLVNDTARQIVFDQLALLRANPDAIDSSIRPEIVEAFIKRLEQVGADIAKLAEEDHEERMKDGELADALRRKKAFALDELVKQGYNGPPISPQQLSFTTDTDGKEWAVLGYQTRALAEYISKLPLEERKGLERILMDTTGGFGMMGLVVDKLGIPVGAEKYYDKVTDQSGREGAVFNPREVTGPVRADYTPAQRRAIEAAALVYRDELFYAAMHNDNAGFYRMAFENPKVTNHTYQTVNRMLGLFINEPPTAAGQRGDRIIAISDPDDFFKQSITIDGKKHKFKKMDIENLTGDSRGFNRSDLLPSLDIGMNLAVRIMNERKDGDGVQLLWESDNPVLRNIAWKAMIANHLRDQKVVSERIASDASHRLASGVTEYLAESGRGVGVSSYDSQIKFLRDEVRRFEDAVGRERGDIRSNEAVDQIPQILKLRNMLAEVAGVVKEFNNRVELERQHLGFKDIRGNVMSGDQVIRGLDPRNVDRNMNLLVDRINTAVDLLSAGGIGGSSVEAALAGAATP